MGAKSGSVPGPGDFVPDEKVSCREGDESDFQESRRPPDEPTTVPIDDHIRPTTRAERSEDPLYRRQEEGVVSWDN